MFQWSDASSRYRYIPYAHDYLNESQLRHIRSRLTLIAMLMVAGLIATQPLAVKSQTAGTLEPRLGQTLVTLHQAESAGATPSEIEALVTLLNKALELDNEALKLNAPDQAQTRADLLAQVEEILTTVQNRATELAAVASQRTYNNRVIAYVGGATTAILATLAYAFIVSFYQKYRIKRTFQMRVIHK